MIKTLSRLVGVLFLLTLTVSGFAQSKPAQKSTPAFKKPKPIANEEVKDEITSPPPVEEDHPVGPAGLPPLPDIDTIPAPNDEFTQEVKKLLQLSGIMAFVNVKMKDAIESQRKMNTNLPNEFYTRMLEKIENGTVGGFIENSAVKIYRKKFTMGEVREVIKFYESPVGKKMAAEAGYISNAARIEGEKVGQYVAIKIIEDLMKEGKWK